MYNVENCSVHPSITRKGSLETSGHPSGINKRLMGLDTLLDNTDESSKHIVLFDKQADLPLLCCHWGCTVPSGLIML